VATDVAPPPLPGGRSIAPPPPPTGGGSWRKLSDERKADIALATKPDSKNPLFQAGIDAARKRQGLADATAPGGGKAEPAKSAEMLEAEQTGSIAAAVIGGLGVIGTGVAIARGGAWWLSLLLLPAAGAAYFLTRTKIAPRSTP